MNQSAYILSIKFAAGSNKEFILFGDNLRKKGLDIHYILASPYKSLEWMRENSKFLTVSNNFKNVLIDTLRFYNGKRFLKIFAHNTPFFLCFYNAHPLNPRIAQLVKREFPEAVLSLYLHDPYKPDKAPYGTAKKTYIKFVELIQGLTIKYMDYVISPSKYSSELFKKKYPAFKGKNYIAPLLVPDQKISDNKNRKYFSIVGSVNPATGHDTFTELVNYAAGKGLDYEFALISSSNISSYIKKLADRAGKKIKIINKEIITDSEINDIIRKSYAVFRLDREVTQSGVVPVSYMNETPVIVRDIPGLRQHVKHEQDGYIVPFNCTPEDLVEAMDYVKNNFNKLSENARNSYEEIWAEWNWDKYYGWLIEVFKEKGIL